MRAKFDEGSKLLMQRLRNRKRGWMKGLAEFGKNLGIDGI
jgi:hypothetical protein